MLTIMCGYPGSGKSTYLKNISESEVILCPDEFRLALTGKAFYGPAEDSVWSHVKITARVLLSRNHHIVIDATNLTKGARGSWLKLAKELGVQIDCYWVNVSPGTAIERNKSREAVVPDHIMDQMISGFVPPTTDEGFWRILKLATSPFVAENV